MRHGVGIGFSGSNTVGGASPAARNLISGNTDHGVNIGSGNQVRGNLIGTQRDGTTALGNGEGVAIFGSSSIVTGNTVAFNEKDGVAVYLDAKGNSVISNSIYDNAEEGIDLRLNTTDDNGPTANDPGDTDSGPNGLQNKPVVRSAKTVKVQFFSNPSGTNEGRKLIGQKSVTTDGSGNATFSLAPAQRVGVGRTVTATATNPGGSTSEFSAPRTVVSA